MKVKELRRKLRRLPGNLDVRVAPAGNDGETYRLGAVRVEHFTRKRDGAVWADCPGEPGTIGQGVLLSDH